MKPTRNLIAAIRKGCPTGVDPDDWLALQLDEIRATKADVARVRQMRQEAKAIHETALAQIAEAEAGVRAKCRHWSATHHSDPAGGSSSWDECDICGKDLTGPECRHS